MSGSPRVSLTMIVRNEETQLAACLRPVAHLFAEMIVVDTGSTDQTREVATELGCRVLDFRWCDDFSAARNEAIRHVTGDWVFWLDADDRLDALNVGRLAKLFRTLDDKNQAYLMSCVSLPRFVSDTAQVIPHCRLFRAHPAIRWRRRVHEQILPSIEPLGHAIVGTDIQIQHLGYQDAALVRRKHQRDLRLLRLEYATDPCDPVTLYYLGMAHAGLGQHAEALPLLRSSLRYATGSGDWVRLLYGSIHDLLELLGHWEEARAILAEAVTRFPHDPALLTRRADLLASLGDYGGAEHCLLELLHAPVEPVVAAGRQTSLDLREGRRLLGCVYTEQRRFEEAERLLQELVRQDPQSVQAWYSLGRTYLAWHRFAEVEWVAQQTDTCPHGTAYAAVLRALISMAQRDWTRARQQLATAISAAPQMLLPRIVLADCLLKSGAPLADCVASQRDILRLQPGNGQAAQTLKALLGQMNREGAVSSPWAFSVSVGL